MKAHYQKLRKKIYRIIEDYFDNEGFTGVELPNLASYLIPESHIAHFSTQQTSPYSESKELFLLPSPELYLKSLIAKGWGNLYCISKSFRNSEQSGKLHNPEFTMLEFYELNANYIDNLNRTQALFALLTSKEAAFINSPLTKPILRLTIDEAFLKYAGHSVKECQCEEDFNYIMVSKIEESLPKDCPVALIDYPSFVPTTAAPCDDPFFCQRWELYVNGIELCNCYTERATEEAMIEYMQRDKKKALSSFDKAYCSLFNHFPACTGNAIGLDRLLMALTGAKTINEVILFPEKDPHRV